ncbi:MAG TPA: flavodoxin family protein [Methanotrichaceae archaeon]|nr:flavodoxin family protein [Methanotrichaceae archaeon]
MKILALVGSPRKGGNTDLLVDQILQGAKVEAQAPVQAQAQAQGHFADKLYLYDYDIRPCIDCRRCKRGALVCKLEDAMAEIYPRLEAADIIIFGTPVYWYGPTAKMKLLIDRLRPFIASGKLKGKRGIVVVPSEEGPDCCGPLAEMFRMSFEYLGMTPAGSILASAYEKGEIKEKPEELRRAYELGASL